MTYKTVLDLWQQDRGFRANFITVLREAPFQAFRWETPPVTRATLSQPFEFVLVGDPWLDLPPDSSPFMDHFKTANEEGIVVFENLGKDALLVVPTPQGPESAYGHLASFSRKAPLEQSQALWQMVGEVMEQRIGENPIWLNTAGGGVAWLHVRLDSRPKYYRFRPYRE